MSGLQQFLAPQVLTNVISRVASTSDWLLNLFGVAHRYTDYDNSEEGEARGGKNCLDMGHGRYGMYHVYNNTRKVAAGRSPGTAAARRAPNPMGVVNFTYPRMHDSIGLSAELLHNLGLISDPSRRDRAGADMIKRQTDHLGQLAKNWRKAMLVGVLRDSLYQVIDGDNTYFTYTQPGGGTYMQVTTQMPSGNKAQLNMLGTGNIIDASWATATTNIPSHIGQINAAFQQLCGGRLAAVICGQKVWNEVVTNEVVAAVHGSSNPPFVVLERDAYEPQIAKTMKNVYRARLSIYPDIIWYITDEGLEVGAPGSETFQKIVPENNAIFLGHEPDDGVLACYEGSEPIAEYDSGPETVRAGLSSWSVKRANPTSTDLFVLDNALVVNHVPASEAYATVLF